MDSLEPSVFASFASTIITVYDDVAAIVHDPSGFSSRIPEVLGQINQLVEEVNGLNSILPAIPDLGIRLLDYLIVSYLRRRVPLLHDLSLLLGVFVYEPVRDANGQLLYERRSVRWDRLGRLISNPASVFQEVYGWGTLDLNSDLFLANIARLLWSLGFASLFEPGENSTNEGYLGLFTNVDVEGARISLGVLVGYLPTEGGKPPGLAIVPAGSADFTHDFPLGSGWGLRVRLSVDAEMGYGILIRPRGDITVGAPPNQGWEVTTEVSLSKAASSGQQIILFGAPNETRLEASTAGITARVRVGSEGGEVVFEINLQGGKLVISPGQGDGFLAKILPPEGLHSDFELVVGWSNRRGLYFRGSVGLETSIAVHQSLGPLRVDSLYVKLGTLQTGEIALTVASSLTVDLGVLTASIDRIGLEAVVVPGAAPDLRFGFKPPSGLGILINAGAVTGGGFLSFDPDQGRYSGALQLHIGSIAVNAVGLLDTRLPGGEQGFSFLIIISAEFSPVQIGMGFTLNGVGGIGGINRTMAVDALQDAVRGHGLDAVLFPHDPVANANQIVSDLRSFFPPAQGRYIFGPMVLLGWGTPTLLEAELGIALELPDPVRIAILGQVSAALPTKEEAIVELHLDVLGLIDFGQKLLSIDAHLHDSKIVVFNISGDMAFRLSWGDPPSFLFSLGGFNPHFTPPAGFPQLQRLTIALGSGDNPRISLQAYLAITSNTFQVGAQAELYAEALGLNVHGWIGFDALFIFSPFSFVTDLSAGVELRAGTAVIAGIHLEAHLSGPSPWHAWGTAHITIVFLDLGVDFDATFGEEHHEELPGANVWDPLEAALRDARSWSTVLPSDAPRVVTVSVPTAPAQAGQPDQPSGDGGPQPVLVDPIGHVAVKQKIVPLETHIDKFGEATPQDYTYFSIASVTVGGAQADKTEVEDLFARAQFESMSDADKLSCPSFEPFPAGVEVAAGAVAHGGSLGRDLVYETKYIDAPDEEARRGPTYLLSRARQVAMVGRGAAASSGTGTRGFQRFLEPGSRGGVVLGDRKWVIASKSDLAVRADLGAPDNRTSTDRALQDYTAAHPEERDNLQVVAA